MADVDAEELKREIVDLLVLVDDVRRTSSQICEKFDLDVGPNYYNPEERGLEKEEKEAVRRKLNQMRKPELVEVALTWLASLYECSEALFSTSADCNA